MRFVGAAVEELVRHRTSPGGGDVIVRAETFIEALEPIGDDFDLPWKFTESLQVLSDFLPTDLCHRLEHPGGTMPTNHLEACFVALALEAGVSLEPLTKTEMQRLQHVTKHMTETSGWGRQSPYPWDTIAEADIDRFDFFALTAET